MLLLYRIACTYEVKGSDIYTAYFLLYNIYILLVMQSVITLSILEHYFLACIYTYINV